MRVRVADGGTMVAVSDGVALRAAVGWSAMRVGEGGIRVGVELGMTVRVGCGVCVGSGVGWGAQAAARKTMQLIASDRYFITPRSSTTVIIQEGRSIC